MAGGGDQRGATGFAEPEGRAGLWSPASSCWQRAGATASSGQGCSAGLSGGAVRAPPSEPGPALPACPCPWLSGPRLDRLLLPGSSPFCSAAPSPAPKPSLASGLCLDPLLTLCCRFPGLSGCLASRKDCLCPELLPGCSQAHSEGLQLTLSPQPCTSLRVLTPGQGLVAHVSPLARSPLVTERQPAFVCNPFQSTCSPISG